MEIFGFSGKLGSGKNYIAERMFQTMLPERKTILLAFANHFKIDAIVKQSLDRNKVFGKKDDHTRRVLQIMGTEEGRDKYGENIWINLAEEWRKYYEGLGYERAIIFDVRFPNEVEYIKQIGGKTIRIESPQRHLDTATREAEDNGGNPEQILNHASEISLDGYTSFDYTIKNDYNDDAVVQVRDYLREYAALNLPQYTFFVDVDDTIGQCHIYYEDTINKVEKLLNEYIRIKHLVKRDVYAVFRKYVKQMRGRVDTTVFIHNRFASDLAWAIHSTITEVDSDPLVDTSGYTREAYIVGMKVYDYPYSALPGAIKAVRKLATMGKVVLFTLGDRLEQAKKIAGLGLSDLPFEVTHDKCTTTFIGLMRKYPAFQHFMIGDNILRDIKPAIEAGIQSTFWINPVYRKVKMVDTDDMKPWTENESLSEAVEEIELRVNINKSFRKIAESEANPIGFGDLVSIPQIEGPKGKQFFYDTKVSGCTNNAVLSGYTSIADSLVSMQPLAQLPEGWTSSTEAQWDLTVTPPKYLGCVVTMNPPKAQENTLFSSMVEDFVRHHQQVGADRDAAKAIADGHTDSTVKVVVEVDPNIQHKDNE